ncbi:MAG: DEAD/DEAH box helicase [Pseudomonadales bacterium]|nr:DEAD/DEAH box helicase [Pseudomonadales bacterium]
MPEANGQSPETPAALQGFHAASRAWFGRMFEQATPAQTEAWPVIREGEHTLIAAPTGSGKTLAAFFAAIDNLVQQSRSHVLPAETRVLYISPLKALSNDIHRNLEVPLAGIDEELIRQGEVAADIRVAVRTGDTSAAERQKMAKTPPHILVTTPESVYLLLTSVSGRRMLASVRTVIIDEIHALLGDKRGSHLALSLERLQHLVDEQAGTLQRIGLSATQKPISLVADYLTGCTEKAENAEKAQPADRGGCRIIDAGHRRQLDVTLEVPGSPLSALMSNEVWEELYQRLLALIDSHHTTLVFVNTRRLSERLAMALGEKLGEGMVSSHHGSMSKAHRQAAEQRLKAGQLKVLIATASMELGIDVGAVDLVVQFSSPKSIATFLQRVGRSGHAVKGVPKGILFPLTRDDLLECTALLDCVHRGELDRIRMPEQPLDILAQQVVAEVAARQQLLEQQDGQDQAGFDLAALYQLCVRAYPYRNLERAQFDELIRMLADGYSTRLGRRGAYLHLDRINQRVSARRNARLTALTNGGAIPDMFDYQVVLDPEETVVGSLNEDFALETLPGDIFTLGSHSWQLLRIDGLKVRVRDARGMKPSIPFWFGEGPGRTDELSQAVSRLRTEIDAAIMAGQLADCLQHLQNDLRLPRIAAVQLLEYLQAGRNALQLMPSRQNLVMERFFDEVGDMHLVIHAPFGSRLNRAWGLALRKRFCRSFNVELQAAANEDSIVISLGSAHSFPLEEVFHYLHSASVEDVLIQALLDAPLFAIRWRWNATRSLAIQRNRNGRRVPPQFQRMDAEDLVAQIFPDQIACLENIQGERRIPDHPLVRQTLHDCLSEAMDSDGLKALLQQLEAGQLRLHALDLKQPSPFAQEIINARPYAFLDDAPFEERRTNAIRNRSWLDPAETADFSVLDQGAITAVVNEAWPLMRNQEELHDALYTLGYLCDGDFARTAPDTNPAEVMTMLQMLSAKGRATCLQLPSTGAGETPLRLWVAAEKLPCAEQAFDSVSADPPLKLPESLRQESWEQGQALCAMIRGRLECSGPLGCAELAQQTGKTQEEIEQVMLQLEAEGFAFQGCFSAPDQKQWCERRLLQRIHRYSIEAHRQLIQPVSLQTYALFLFELHELRTLGLQPRPQALPSQLEGDALLQRVLDRMDGLAVPAAAWEGDIFPARMTFYDPAWLDRQCNSGQLVWGRYKPQVVTGAARLQRKQGAGPVSNTPITLARRQNNPLWLTLAQAERGTQELSFSRTMASSTAEKILSDLEQYGASFFSDIAGRTGLLGTQLEKGLGELVNAGMISSDGFSGLRALLTPEARKPRSGRGRRQHGAGFALNEAGRWFVLPQLSAQALAGNEENGLTDTQLESVLMIYLHRWGVVFRQVLERETAAPPWWTLLRVLKQMELQGKVRGGRFIAGIGGEQFALEATVQRLRALNRDLPAQEECYEQGRYHSLAAVDPINLLSIFLPQAGLSRLRRNRVLYRNGIPLAVLDSGNVRFLRDVPDEYQWALQKLLQGHEMAPQVWRYLHR